MELSFQNKKGGLQFLKNNAILPNSLNIRRIRDEKLEAITQNIGALANNDPGGHNNTSLFKSEAATR